MAPPSSPILICTNPHSHFNTTNQIKGECLRSVNHFWAYAAGSPLPPDSILGSALPPHRRSASSHLVRYVHVQTINNGREETRTELKNAPPLPTKERKKERIGPSLKENMDKYQSVISEVEGAAGFIRIQK